MKRPIIGLTTYGEMVKFGSHDTFAAVLHMTYVQAVNASGGTAVLLTQDDPDPDVISTLDGIVLTGGPDVDPSHYGEAPHERTYTRPARDAAELVYLRAALDTDLPILGVCRGMQLMTVVYGGRLIQHLPDVLGHDGHRPANGPRYGTHPVRLAPGSACADILGVSTTVNSMHHQAVADVGRLTAVGWAPEPDGSSLIEAVEDPSKRFAVGVQWHPEETDDLRLFVALVEAARLTRPLNVS
jgi:putative glutamine amidotransferase